MPQLLERSATPDLPLIKSSGWIVEASPEDSLSAPRVSDPVPSEPVHPGFGDILLQISSLCAGGEEDDYGILKPTPRAVVTTIDVLLAAYGVRRQAKRTSFPRGSVTTDEQGGLRIEWKGGGNAVRLVIPAQEKGRSYIYHEADKQYDTEKKVSGATLASWLTLID